MTIEINVQGRFKVLDQPMASPSKCAFCGLGHNQDGTVSFIDTTLDLDFYGVVYICSNCLIEISASLGFITSEAWVRIRDDAVKTKVENEQLRAENDELRSCVNTLTVHRCVDNALRPALSEDEWRAEIDEFVDGTSEGSEPSESKPDAPSSKSGLSDVRGTSKPKSGSAKSSTKSAAESDADAVSDLFDI